MTLQPDAITLQPYHFDERSGSWILQGTLPPAALKDRITLVTWNVWFGTDYFQARYGALMEIIRSCDPGVIALQEVTPEFLRLLLEETWLQSEYWISDATGDTIPSYGVVLLSRLPASSLVLYDLPSGMERKLLAANLSVAGRSLMVGRVHLESMRWNADLRAEQLQVALPILAGSAPDSVIMGDFNFCSSWTDEGVNMDEEWIDMWPALEGSNNGYTVDSVTNQMRFFTSGKHKRVRFDRILLRSPGGRWQPHSIRLLGTHSIPPKQPDVFPSDHFGLAALLNRGAGR